MVQISKASVLRILQSILKLEKKSARLVPHLHMEEQECMHVKMAHKLLKRFPRFDQKKS